MAKLDISNWFWSIRLPWDWEGVFSGILDDQRYIWESLPFGWKYSLVICQKLLFGLTDGALWNIPVLYFVSMDDILLVRPRRVLRRAALEVGKVAFLNQPQICP